MKPWARKLAVWTSLFLMFGSLAAAWIEVAQTPPQPKGSLLATGLASLLFLMIRYLTRPRVKAWFSGADGISTT